MKTIPQILISCLQRKLVLLFVTFSILISCSPDKNEDLTISENEKDPIQEPVYEDNRGLVVGEYTGLYLYEYEGYASNYELIDTFYTTTFTVTKVDSFDIEISPSYSYFRNRYPYSDTVNIYGEQGSHYSYIRYRFEPDSSKLYIESHLFAGNGTDYDMENILFEGLIE